MSRSDSFENIFPLVLENMAQEMGDLVGETLELENEKISQGNLHEVFSPPDKQSVLVSFKAKDGSRDPAYLLVDLNFAIELGAKLILLPEDEISAIKKSKKLEGEVEDAFSEITNIITGALTTTCQQNFQNKLHFIRGDLQVFPPRSQNFPFPQEMHTGFSGAFVSESKKAGNFQMLFPHTLLEDEKAQEEADYEDSESKQTADLEEAGEVKDVRQQGLNEKSRAEAEDDAQKKAPDQEERTPPETGHSAGSKTLDRKTVDTFFLDSLPYAENEIAELLGSSIEFADPQTRCCGKEELLKKTKGKQVLTRIGVSGEQSGEAYILLPLKDAIFLGGTLLLMPPESITQTIKQGQFEGDVADASGEILNILVGCYSIRFKEGFPLKLALKKESIESIVPSQVDLTANEPFAGKHFYLLSTGIRMENRMLGPIDILFPLEMLGLENNESLPEKAGVRNEEKVQSQKDHGCQKNDSSTDLRTISLIGHDQEQFEAIQESITDENIELVMLSPDSDLKQSLGRKNVDCAFLFIKKTNDLGFAQTIKVRAALNDQCPLVLAGPEWTKTKVLKALKYGANDILITPANIESIREKYQKHLFCNKG
mgnify:CR=1 FL=1